MRSVLWVSLVGFVIAAALGAWLIIAARPPTSDATLHPAESPKAAAMVERPELQLAAASPPHVSPAAATPVPPTLPIDGELPRGEQEKTREQLIFELQQKFEAAPPPDAQAVEIEHELALELGRAIQGIARLRSLDCKATICRAVMAFATVDDDRSSLLKLLEPMDGPVARFGFTVDRETSPAGAVTSTLFMNLK